MIALERRCFVGGVAAPAEPKPEVNTIRPRSLSLIDVGTGDVDIPTRVQLAHLHISEAEPVVYVGPTH